jgi:hypothetical protein
MLDNQAIGNRHPAGFHAVEVAAGLVAERALLAAG